jgi:chromosome segregation ATPase
MHHLRNTCSNDLTERSEVLEKRLLQGLQDAVLRPDVVEYTIKKLESELDSRFEAMSTELEAVRKSKSTLEAEVRRLTQALATGGSSRVPAAVITAINEREKELRSISDRLLQGNRDSIQAQVQDIREFVLSTLSDVRSLLHSDVPTAKAEILRHVDRIDLTPMEANGERFFVASGEWNLLGSFPSTKSVGAAGRS